MPCSRHARAVLSALLSLCLIWCSLVMLPLPARAVADDGATVVQPTLSRLRDIGGLSAKSAVLIDADSGQVLYGKDEHVRLPMASTTKIMTALCAVRLADVSTQVKVDAAAVGVEGSSIYLREGEVLTLEQLLYALLLESANDAAVAIAIAVSGSVEAFASVMNETAAALGLENTHFENPHGLDGEQHYTTAQDLALIAREALNHPILKKIFATRKITIPLSGDEGVRLLLNHNKMLRYYNGAIGVKTGFTKRSGRCLVSAAARDGLTLIAVTLCAPDDWNDHTRMLDAGFAAFERVSLCEQGGFESMVPVTGGKEGYVIVRNARPVSLTLPRDRASMLCTVELERFLYAPVRANAVVGSLIFRCDTNGDGERETLATVPLRAAYGVEQQKKKTWFSKLGAWLLGQVS